MTMYSLRNADGQFLKYAFKNKFIFNGENDKARKIIIYHVKKEETIKRMLENAISQGFENCTYSEVTEKDLSNDGIASLKKNEEKIYYDESLREQINYECDYPFESINAKCVTCACSCKQSGKAVIYSCQQYIRNKNVFKEITND